jgi:hypothetical protein
VRKRCRRGLHTQGIPEFYQKYRDDFVTAGTEGAALCGQFYQLTSQYPSQGPCYPVWAKSLVWSNKCGDPPLLHCLPACLSVCLSVCRSLSAATRTSFFMSVGRSVGRSVPQCSYMRLFSFPHVCQPACLACLPNRLFDVSQVPTGVSRRDPVAADAVEGRARCGSERGHRASDARERVLP